ncbi:heavy metal-associated isoprenylated plant protein 16-like [Humulus lupulus]|uniref:heavy metal-associated isoprenylated plant protein 16-like n=1 Tax=Humulus lupulus TaxID=3486 RepID=UPI002B4055E6|nr:heavy metal-associated isoprenylated plant protein 16-like [Humulus lupulus]
MKQKVVIKVALNDQKCRTKALKTAVGVDGVTQASLQQEKSQIEVTGEDIDVVLLTTLLRKSLKRAEVVSVSPVEKKEEKTTSEVAQLQPHPHPFFTPITYYEVSDHQPSCSIM